MEGTTAQGPALTQSRDLEDVGGADGVHVGVELEASLGRVLVVLLHGLEERPLDVLRALVEDGGCKGEEEEEVRYGGRR